MKEFEDIKAPLFAFAAVVAGFVIVASATIIGFSSFKNLSYIPQVAQVGGSSSYLNIISPNGGEQWMKGTNHTITWANNSLNNVQIALVNNGGTVTAHNFWLPIISNYNASTQSYTWSIPVGGGIPDGLYKIWIGELTYFHGDFSDSAFNITSPTIINYVIPSVNSTLNSSTSFAWNSVSGATSFVLALGSTAPNIDSNQFSTDIAFRPNITPQDANITGITVTNIPQDGRTLYLTIGYYVNGAWKYQYFTYKAGGSSGSGETTIGGAQSTITQVSPLAGSTVSSNTNLSWNLVSGALGYWVYVGSSAGAKDILTKAASSNNTSFGTLPTDGRTLYVRIWYQLSSGWQYKDFTYKAITSSGSTSSSGITGMSPANGTTLTGSSQEFSWNPVSGATAYWLYLGTSVGAKDIWTGTLNLDPKFTLAIVNHSITYYVRIWYKISGEWHYQDFKYPTSAGISVTLSSISPTSGPAGTAVTAYGSGFVSPTYVHLVTSGISGYTNLTPSAIRSDGGALTFSIPTYFSPGSVAVRISKDGVETNAATFTVTSTSGSGETTVSNSTITHMSPANGTVLTGTSQAFSWTAASGASEYWLYVGKTAGGKEIYSGTLGAATHFTLSSINHTLTYYVRIWYKISGTWHYQDFRYPTS